MSSRHALLVVVDESHDHAVVVEELLTEAGFGIVKAFNGPDAVHAVRRKAVDCIVLGLPSASDGVAALTGLRREQRTAHLPVVIVAEEASDLDGTKASELGAMGFLTQPLDQPGTLSDLVSRAIGMTPSD